MIDIETAPSYAPLCGLDRDHKMVYCENCGPENVWCLDCHNPICGGCYEQLNFGIWMYSFRDTFIFEDCEHKEDKFCKLEGDAEKLCGKCKVAATKLDDA